MAEANTAAFNLSEAGPSELEARRRSIIQRLASDYKGYDDPNVPLELLQELAAITASLRRKTAGPPKVAKRNPSAPKPTADDLLI